MSNPFERLRERLLKAGVAPRHVARYVGELRAHLEDAIADELAQGRSPMAAEAAALARLGEEDALAEAILARPQLRSIASRAPWLVFGAAPVVLVPLGFVGILLFQGLVAKLLFLRPGELPPAWAVAASGALNWSAMHLLPVAVGLAFALVAAWHRMKFGWVLLATTVASLLGATPDMSTRFSTIPGRSELSAGVGFNSDRTPGRAAASLAVALLVSGATYAVRRRAELRAS